MFVPMIFQFTTTSNNFDTYVSTQAVRLYADPGTKVTFSPFVTPPGGSTGTLKVFTTRTRHLGTVLTQQKGDSRITCPSAPG